MSEQFLVNCAYDHYFGQWGAFGCSGAWPQAYLDYLETVSGGQMQTESSYPYTGTDGACRSSDQGLLHLDLYRKVLNQRLLKKPSIYNGPVYLEF